MASLPALPRRPWRALHQALGILGLTFTVGVVDAVTPAPAAAAPAALTVRPKAKARKAAKGAKKKTSTSKRARSTSRARAANKARRTSASRPRAGRAERLAPRPSADLVSVPTVVLPELALAAAGPDAAAGGNPFTLIARSATSLLDGLVARARSQLGTRYVYGGASPDAALDCSSFARYVMEALNVRLPRTANQQARVGTAVPRDVAALRPGDLLTFGSPRRTSHVGIYLGEGRFIHASVKSGQVIETTIDRNRSLFRRWQGARRLLAGTSDGLADSAATTPSGG